MTGIYAIFVRDAHRASRCFPIFAPKQIGRAARGAAPMGTGCRGRAPAGTGCRGGYYPPARNTILLAFSQGIGYTLTKPIKNRGDTGRVTSSPVLQVTETPIKARLRTTSKTSEKADQMKAPPMFAQRTPAEFMLSCTCYFVKLIVTGVESSQSKRRREIQQAAGFCANAF